MQNKISICEDFLSSQAASLAKPLATVSINIIVALEFIVCFTF